MTDQALDILKLVLLALLYLFFARVLWAVWSEVRNPADTRSAGEYQPVASGAADATMVATPAPAAARTAKPKRGHGDAPARLYVLEPKDRRGAIFPITNTIGLGRDDDNTIQITGDTYISAHHARITDLGGRVVIDDLGSTNGSFLNGSRLVNQATVHIGDRIQLGYTVLEAQ